MNFCHADVGSIQTIAKEASSLLGLWHDGIDASCVSMTKLLFSMTRLSFGTTKNHKQSDRKKV